MHKFSLIAASVSMALAATANAAPIAGTKMFMSGASAPSNMLREHVVQTICSPGTIKVYVDTVKTAPTAAVYLAHTEQWVVQCTTLNNSALLGTNLANKQIAFYKSDAGGSGTGTTPVGDEDAITFLNADTDLAKCPLHSNAPAGISSAYELYQCGTDELVDQVPDMGASDVEPGKFVATLSPASGDFIDRGNIVVKAGPGLVFGIGVSKLFRNELQLDQLGAGCVGVETAACMPSLPHSYVSAVTQGRLGQWGNLALYGQTVNLPATFNGVAAYAGTPFVHICRRTQGSGTHAQHMMEYHDTNCTSTSVAMPGASSAAGIVYQNSSSGTLGKCLDAVDRGIARVADTEGSTAIAAGTPSFALGYQSLEKNVSNSESWRYVAIDGVLPTLANAFSGDYSQVYYMSFQRRTADAPAAAGTPTAGNGVLYENTATDIRTVAADAGAIADMYNNGMTITAAIIGNVNQGFNYTWGQSGYLQPSATPGNSLVAATPLTPWIRETAAKVPDSCQPLSKKQP